MLLIVEPFESIEPNSRIRFSTYERVRDGRAGRFHDSRLLVAADDGNKFLVSASEYVGTLVFEPEFLEWYGKASVFNEDSLRANKAWCAGRESVLDKGRSTLAGQVALAVLGGEEKELHVLVDWLEENGRLEGVVKDRLGRLRKLLERTIPWVSIAGGAELVAAIREELPRQ